MREEHIKDRVTLNTVEEDMASTVEADERAALLDASRRAPIPTYEANPEGEARRQPGGATSFEFLALLKHSYPGMACIPHLSLPLTMVIAQSSFHISYKTRSRLSLSLSLGISAPMSSQSLPFRSCWHS